MDTLNETIERHGGDPSAVLRFESDAPELLPYATLISARNAELPDFDAVEGIYEWQHRPLILLVSGEKLQDDQDQLARLRRAAAMRGDAPYLGVIHPGRLTVYQVNLDNHSPHAARVALSESADEQRAVIPYLGNSRPEASQRNWISDVVLRLLTASIDSLLAEGISDEDAISLVGRALFVRFLADRSLLSSGTLPKGYSEVDSLFDTAKGVAATSRWLDKTFNGDFLPLTGKIFESLTDGALNSLGDILRRAPGGQLHLGWKEKWDRLDFSHIPVGVLSQTYELYLTKHDPVKQRREGGYYTPRHIADLMTQAAFRAISREGSAHLARVLDPSAGAGVFLLTAFRHLVAERWRQDNCRPDTKKLRSILYEQIAGFDSNESALRFAALGLYLISIELDPNPEPLEKLKFQNLRPNVLRKFVAARRIDDEAGPENTISKVKLGSLGDEVGEEHIGVYDLVIGNPPWATSTRLQGWDWLQQKVNEIARERLQDEGATAPIPNEVLDLPFVWRALEWAKPSGQIAFALHARLLFQQGETMPQARHALFSALDVTGIVNGTEVRATKVWPEITAPFCLLFARNQRPAPGAAFRFVTPRLERPLNRTGAWRIDVTSSERITSEEVRTQPYLLKTLFRGSRLDLEIHDRVSSSAWPTLKQYWQSLFGSYRGRPRCTGNGYQRLRDSSEIQRSGDGLPGVSADYLHPYLEFEGTGADGLVIDESSLKQFRTKRIHRKRPIEIFKAPLLLVRESPPVASGRIRTSVSFQDIIYNQSYHGYSAREHDQGELLTCYLALVIGSSFALWRALITSGRFGFEREVIEKFIIDTMPVPPLESLSAADRRRIKPLFKNVSSDDHDEAWNEVDKWVGSLYGLSSAEVQIIADTLRFNLPFADNRNQAQIPPSLSEINRFSTTLANELHEWTNRLDRSLSVVPVATPDIFPWLFVRLSINCSEENGPLPNPYTQGIVNIGDAMSATEIIVVDDTANCLWLGRLKQARYWSHNQAILAARYIVWEHLEFLTGKNAA